MLRFVSSTLIAAGVAALGFAARDELRGETLIPTGLADRDVVFSASFPRGAAVKRVRISESPKTFRNAMFYRWGVGPILIGGGMLLQAVRRRAEQTDSFSPVFGGSAAVDDLTRTLEKEAERRRRPLR